MEKDTPPQLVTPASVKAIISRIEAAQLTRAQEDISSQLSDILDNVNCVISRFQEELGYDFKKKAKSHQTEQKGKNRFILLEKITSFSKDAETKEKHLYEILHWLGDWGDSLTYEIRNRKSEEEEEALDEWIEVMEKVLPLSLIATKGGIESLISLCSTLIEGQKKGAQRTSLRKVTQLPLHISLVTPKRKVYHMDVEAQRRNLQLLSEEGQLGLPDYLRSKALELTTTTMELNALWLQCLCHKYILYRRFQGLRQEMINRIQVVQKTEFAWRAQNLYIFLENINHLQNLQLQAWTDKQKDLGEKCQECLSSMVTMFPKLQLEWNVNLHTPVVTSPKSRKSKPPPSLLQHTHSSSSSCKQPLELFMSGGQQLVPLRVACASVTQRKEHQELPDESAELIRKKSNESFPETKSQKDRDNPSPHAMP